MASPLQSRALHALVGVLATVTGMAAGHLVAALLDPSASPVVAVGSEVIDRTPTPVKTWAIDQFGNADKPILIGSVIVVTLILAAVAGILARRRRAAGTVLLLVLVGAAGAAAMLRPTATVVDLLPALATAAVGVGVFWLLLARIPARRAPDAAADAAPAADASPGAPVTSDAGATPAARPDVMVPGGARRAERPSASRRGFLVLAGATTAAAAVMAGAGELIGRAGRAISVALPRPAQPIPALPTGLEERFEGISPFQTPREDFYRVDINLTVPVVDESTWRLTVDGDVEEPYTLSFDELLEMPLVERDITMTCVSNNVGGPYVGSARWLGVPMREILARARPSGSADAVLSTAVDGFTISTPLDVLTDPGRDALVVVGMNGEPLPREHGFPVRMITPGIYGYVGATKWLERLTVTRFDEVEAYWTERGWDVEAPIKMSSRIDTPQSLSRIPAGETVIGGVAWAQPVGVAKVEIAVDGGEWQECELGPAAETDDNPGDYWRQWFHVTQLDEGQHRFVVRCTNDDGQVQTDVKADDFPNGSSGLHNILVIAE
ncbi:molybdopterin-dependent oxidoreductase [Nocardioides perillae]|uniref:DMSO/TMAO reductase YedYZ molybdopterin-dependent catalytic subunit n=1 Tax=Nocardioides perillae TaxID=1119534 RepID=A0A7Y9RT16_9ACTN|nr:molybdopterin-dependent oxidoreductase [Nocardioides perillae]NYG54032.1 DMSO/TMAO reductase YedYZ molybdopterin-dependent catalytic subunit [Nocardioides perillae]